MRHIVVVGGGFAGLWSAAGAARKLAEAGVAPGTVHITLVERNDYHSIRVRNYEADLAPTIVPLDEVLKPIGVDRVEGELTGIDLDRQRVQVATPGGGRELSYDRLVFALGSQLHRPDIPGLAEHSFDVDTYRGAMRLARHLERLRDWPDQPGRSTVLVVGAGLTGIETACEMRERLPPPQTRVPDPRRVILADAGAAIGSDMGEDARGVIVEALSALGVETRPGIAIAAIDAQGATLANGEPIAAATIVWCAGMRAHPLTAQLGVARDRFGRVPVDEFMRVEGVPHVFAAGDAAWWLTDGVHACVMSCQHARPMGRHAGHNAVAELLGLPMLPLAIDWYVTVLDLGPWGAVYTVGWDRQVIATRADAKRTKQTINRQRIYPPQSGKRADLLDAAAPLVQVPPEVLARR